FAVAALTACAVRRDVARVPPMGVEFTTFVRWNSPFGAAGSMYSLDQAWFLLSFRHAVPDRRLPVVCEAGPVEELSYVDSKYVSGSQFRADAQDHPLGI